MDNIERVGILLVNIGTPEAPTSKAVRAFLKEFLLDPRVVELPRFIWWPILNGLILNIRSSRSALRYAQIWQNDGGPLRVWTEKQTQLLQDRIDQALGDKEGKALFELKLAMRYGKPTIAEQMTALKTNGCNRMLIAPLYPQYAASTTASVMDAVAATLSKWRWQPAIRTLPAFPLADGYIKALAERIRQYWPLTERDGHLVLSFHGLPERAIKLGDPYQHHCHQTADALIQALGLSAQRITVSFQSRFGFARWLGPSTQDVLVALGRKRTAKLYLFCPGFVSDCIETLEEIAIEGKQIFLNAGGQEYHFIPCLNDTPTWIEALFKLISQELSGWLALPYQ